MNEEKIITVAKQIGDTVMLIMKEVGKVRIYILMRNLFGI